MKKVGLLIALFLTASLSFASSEGQPKKVILQTSLDHKIVVTLPEINLSGSLWGCRYFKPTQTSSGGYNCFQKEKTRQLPDQNLLLWIGNSKYKMTDLSVTFKVQYLDKDITDTPVLWKDIESYSKDKDVYFYGSIRGRLEEVDTGSTTYFRLTPEKITIRDARTYAGKVIENY